MSAFLNSRYSINIKFCKTLEIIILHPNAHFHSNRISSFDLNHGIRDRNLTSIFYQGLFMAGQIDKLDFDQEDNIIISKSSHIV